MNFFKKITHFFSNLLPKKTEVASEKKDKSKASEVQEVEISEFKNFILKTSSFTYKYLKFFILKTSSFTYKYLKRFVLFVLGLINTMMQPMIKISKKHPIAFWAAIILHIVILSAVIYADIPSLKPPKANSNIMPTSVAQAIVIDMEIIEEEQDRLKDVEKQKQQKLKNEEERSETAQEALKIATQNALLEKARRAMATFQRESEEAKTKKAEILASRANEIIADAESKTKVEEAKAKKAEVKRIAEEAKTKEAEILVEEAAKKIELAEAKRKKEEVKTKLAEIKRKAVEAKTQKAEILAKEATAVVKEAEAKTKAEEAKTKEAEAKTKAEEIKAKEAVKKAVLLAQETARDAEILAKEVEKQVKKAEAKRIAEELKFKEAEAKRIALEIEIKEAEVKQSATEAKTKEAELLVKKASKQLEQDQQNKDLLELDIAALKEAEAEIQYRQLLAREVQDEQDTARSIIIADQLTTLKSAYVNNIAARVRTYWRYQGAADDWSCLVYVQQDENGKVEAVNIKNCNLDDSEKARAFKNSIERAVYKASPLPPAPDDAVFDRQILFEFVVN